MPFRIQTALFCLIAAPLAMLVWIGFALLRAEELRVKRQVTSLAEGRLLELVRSIDDVMSSQQRNLKQRMEQASMLPEDLVSLEWTEPHVRRTMWVSSRGQLLHPQMPSTNANNEFLLYNELSLMARQRPPVPIEIRKERIEGDRRTSTGEITKTHAKPADTVQPSYATPSLIIEQEASNSHSPWQESYFDEGLQLVVWSVRADGSAIGCWLERARWIADLIAALPDVDPAFNDAATVLVDANGDSVYRWGASDVQVVNAIAESGLKEPLASWRIRYYVPVNRAGTLTELNYWPWVLGIATGALVLLALGSYVSFAIAQQLRLANQRVSFVGQVSHELRTPLTNIRLYAEMAQRDLSQDEPVIHRIAERIAVIDSESKRLSRLIAGVLEFMQGRSKEQSLAWRTVVPDEIIRQVLTQCSISLERSGIVVSSELNAAQEVEMDSDVLEQILINLINNVEKYAESGKSLNIVSSLESDMLTIDIRDGGPGIPTRFFDRVFQPFFRLDDDNTAPSGTGLGLTIARKAAKRHGGGLELVASKSGAHFRLRLRIRLESDIPVVGEA